MRADIAKLLKIVNIDKARIALAKRRHAAVFRHEKPDRWPIRVWAGLTPEQERVLPAALPDSKDYSFENRLYRWLRFACQATNSRSDLIPFVYPDFGCYQTVACLGMDGPLTGSDYWAPEPLSKDKIATLSTEDIRVRGRAEEAIAFIRFVRENLGDALDICCAETSSPVGIAQTIMGHDLFMEMYDHPEAVHRLLDLAVELIKRFGTWQKEAAGVPMNTCHMAGGGLYSESFGLQIDDDESVLLSPGAIAEFSMPYLKRLADAFGGASIHYCGRHDGFTREIWAAPELKGINFGVVPGKEHEQRFEWVMEGCLASGTVSYGYWPIRAEESVEDYLRRLYSWASRGCLIPDVRYKTLKDSRNAAIVKDPMRLLDFWESLHSRSERIVVPANRDVFQM